MTFPVRLFGAVVAIALATAGCGTPVEPEPLEWLDQASGSTAAFRGASAVSDSVAWASGIGGTVVRTVDGGETWQTRTVPGLDTDEFRDIEPAAASTLQACSVFPSRRADASPGPSAPEGESCESRVSDAMEPGTILGSYEIVAKLGEGGPPPRLQRVSPKPSTQRVWALRGGLLYFRPRLGRRVMTNWFTELRENVRW